MTIVASGVGVHCPQCDTEKDEGDFYRQGAGRRSTRCKVCYRANAAARKRGEAAPYIKPSPAKDAWTEFSDDVIRRLYPEGGSTACARLLPDRSIGAIHSRAQNLGVRMSGHKITRQDASMSPVPRQEFADAHRLWMSVDRSVRPDPVVVLAPRIAA